MSSTSYGQNFNTKYELSTDSATMACEPVNLTTMTFCFWKFITYSTPNCSKILPSFKLR